MARSTYKITLLLQWFVLVREVMTQGQTLPETAAPELQDMMLGPQNIQESENEANEMGRNAAEDMGALMASPPMKTFRLPHMSSDNDQPDYSTRPQCNHNDAVQWYPSSEPSGRSAVARTIPLAPLPPLPLISGLTPVPFLSPLIQSLTNPGRLGLGFGARPFLRTAFPYMPALRAPLPYPYTVSALRSPLTPTLPALRNPLSTYQLPRMNKVWIPQSPLRARSTSTPNNYARSANQYKPLVFYV